MGDGAMCHYCRRYNCICKDEDDGEFARALQNDDSAWFTANAPFRVLRYRTTGDFTLCNRNGDALQWGRWDRASLENCVTYANLLAMQLSARALVEKIDEVRPALDSAFLMAFVHGQSYDGPSFAKELEALRRQV